MGALVRGEGAKIIRDLYRGQVRDMYYRDVVALSGGEEAFMRDGASSRAAKTAKAFL